MKIEFYCYKGNKHGLENLPNELLKDLPDWKRDLINLASSFADRVEKQQLPNSKSKWHFYFDEGVFCGETHITINQSQLDAMSIMLMLRQVNWPGFISMYEKANQSILKILKDDRGNNRGEM